MTLIKVSFNNSHILPCPHDILEFLQQKNHCKISKKDIIKAFKIDDNLSDDFKNLLKFMRKENLIIKTSGNYYYINDKDVIKTTNAIIYQHLKDNIYQAILNSDLSNHIPAKIIVHASTKKCIYQSGDIVTIKLKKSNKKNKLYGKIIDTHNRKPLATTGIVKKTFTGLEVVPTNKKEKWVYQILENDVLNPEHGDLVRFKLPHNKPKIHRHYTAEVTEIIKRKVNHIESISLIALEDNHIPYEFSHDVLNQANIIPEISKDNDNSNRIDLTHLPFITIDPKDARDHDDAVYAELNSDTDGATLYVAIADVSAYVQTNSVFDTEARLRGNSIYLPDRVIPMLPERLSNNLCSLKANTTRPVLVVKIELDNKGEKTHHEFMRAFIHCQANLTYEDVYHALENPKDTQFLAFQKTVIQPLIKTYKLLQIAQEKRNPLNLDLPEYQIILDNQKHPIDVIKKTRLATHKLIEEFMVLANVCAAETIEQADIPVVYRSHEEPPADKIASLKETLTAMGIVFKSKTTLNSRMFNRLLADTAATAMHDIISKMVLRCQCQAIYTPDNQGHFGLNLKKYAHFTSPIRRYADLLVHRSLIKGLNLGSDGITDDELSLINDICNHISKTERRAITAEMETKDRFLAEFLKSKTSQQFKGVISGLTNAGIFVRLPDCGAEGFVPIVNLSQFTKKRRYFQMNEARHLLKDKYSGQYYIIGQNIRITLVEVNLLTGGMVFNIVDDSDLNEANTLIAEKKTKKKLGKKKKAIKTSLKQKRNQSD